jgi:hypothetical protein
LLGSSLAFQLHAFTHAFLSRALSPLSLAGFPPSLSLPPSQSFFVLEILGAMLDGEAIETTTSGFFFQRRCDNHWSNDCQWLPASLFNPPA